MMIGITESLPLGVLQSMSMHLYSEEFMHTHTFNGVFTFVAPVCMHERTHVHACMPLDIHVNCTSAEVIFSLRRDTPPDLMAMLSLVTTWCPEPAPCPALLGNEAILLFLQVHVGHEDFQGRLPMNSKTQSSFETPHAGHEKFEARLPMISKIQKHRAHAMRCIGS